MSMRILVVSTAPNTNRIVDEIKRQAGPHAEIVLHVGHVNDDIKASAIARLNTREGGQGHPFSKQRWTGAAQVLFESPEFTQKMEEFIDHLHRRSEINAYKSHPLRSMQDYADYYHILADVIAQQIVERGVTHCLFFNVPHLTYDTIVYQIAKAMGLPCLIVTESLFPNRYFSMTDVADLGRFAPRPDAAPFPIEQDTRPDLFYMQGIKQEREAGGRLSLKAMMQLALFLALHRPIKLLNPVYVARLMRHMGRIYGAFPKWRDPFARFFHEEHLSYFDHLAQFEDQTLDLSGDYVYFPLQLQPEMTTSALGGAFRDQAYAIERLAAILPEGMRILVKENPKQVGYMRGPMFFHRLQRIQSVTFLPSWADTHALTDGARFVASITGTVGWEAIRQGKPALVFGKAWYRKLPGVHEFHDKITVEEITQPFAHADLEAAMGALLANAHEGVVDRHYAKTVADYDDTANTRQVAGQILHLLEHPDQVSFGAAQTPKVARKAAITAS